MSCAKQISVGTKIGPRVPHLYLTVRTNFVVEKRPAVNGRCQPSHSYLDCQGWNKVYARELLIKEECRYLGYSLTSMSGNPTQIDPVPIRPEGRNGLYPRHSLFKGGVRWEYRKFRRYSSVWCAYLAQ
jgi:hypothetical protein